MALGLVLVPFEKISKRYYHAAALIFCRRFERRFILYSAPLVSG
jgi:hypothetical protein